MTMALDLSMWGPARFIRLVSGRPAPASSVRRAVFQQPQHRADYDHIAFFLQEHVLQKHLARTSSRKVDCPPCPRRRIFASGRVCWRPAAASNLLAAALRSRCSTGASCARTPTRKPPLKSWGGRPHLCARVHRRRGGADDSREPQLSRRLPKSSTPCTKSATAASTKKCA